MAKCSIYLESGQVWRREESPQRDPLRVFPELFTAKATGHRVAVDEAKLGPEFQIVATTDSFVVSAQAPGITAARLEVRVTAQLLIIVGKEAPVNAATDPTEPGTARWRAAFRRTFVLPTAVDARRLKVDIVGDLLTIKLPKRMSAEKQRDTQKRQ